MTKTDSKTEQTQTSEPPPVRFETRGRVGIVTLDRPGSLNALSRDLGDAMLARCQDWERDQSIGCILVRGVGKAFSAGADIAELSRQTYRSRVAGDVCAGWDRFARLRVPKVAVVGGYALGGGCELAMMCDIVLAGRSARFGQPEIKLGLIPGMGGTQRLTRLVGRAKAMDLILTGRMMDAEEAERAGLVSRIVDDEQLDAEALDVAATVAGYSRHTLLVATETVDRAEQTSLTEGLLAERRNYDALFDTPDAT